MQYDIQTPVGNAKHFPEENLVRVYDDNGELIKEIAVDPSFKQPQIQQVDPELQVQADLQNAILVTQNSPYNTPEEQAIVDNTVNLALASYRQLINPTELTIKLATDLLSWRI